ncbi:MAG TPA: DUF4261 domain-containing protein [Pirellulales bacterium]
MTTPPQLVIGVPGAWANRSDIVGAIVGRSGGYIFAGAVMLKIGTKDAFKLEIYDRDPNLRRAFAAAGYGRFTEADLAPLDSHTFTLYLVTEGGSIESARKAMHAAQGLLNAGGLAVKIESSGVAHLSTSWKSFCDDDDLHALFRAYVTFVGDDGDWYTCGLHNLGLPDVSVEDDVTAQEAGRLLQAFAGYLLFEEPTLNDGETFSVDAEAPLYRLQHVHCTRFEDDLFHNPYGLWKLTPV